MPELLTIGPATTLVQNQGYAMPARRVLVRTSGTLEASMDNSSYTAVTTSNNQVELAAPFLRSTASGTIVTLKAL